MSPTSTSLVGGFNHLEKYEFVNGKDYPIYEMENNPFMFETTNQKSDIENGPVEIVDLPIDSMVDLSIVFC